MLLVIINGQSGTGKSEITNRLLTKLKKKGIDAQKLNMDDYYKEIPEGVNITEYRNNTNFDTPNMLHFDVLSEHINQLNQGNPIVKNILSFITNRYKGQETINPTSVVVMEGIFGEYFYENHLSPEINAIVVNVTTSDYLDVLGRRIRRDEEQRGRNREATLKIERRDVGAGFFQFTGKAVANVHIINTYAEDSTKQENVLNAACKEIIEEINTNDGKISRFRIPEARHLVAQSHVLAGNTEFNGYFNGVFGDYEASDYHQVLVRTNITNAIQNYVNNLPANLSFNERPFNHKFAQTILNMLTAKPKLPLSKIYEMMQENHRLNDFLQFTHQHDVALFEIIEDLIRATIVQEMQNYISSFKVSTRADLCFNKRPAAYYLARELLNNLKVKPELPLSDVFDDVSGQLNNIIKAKNLNDSPELAAKQYAPLLKIIEKAQPYVTSLRNRDFNIPL